MRPGTAKAREILAGIMTEFGVDLAALRTHGSRSENLCMAKEAYIVRCAAAGIQTCVMAEVIGLGRDTVYYRANAEARARKNARQNQRREEKPPRSKAKVRVSAWMGQWS